MAANPLLFLPLKDGVQILCPLASVLASVTCLSVRKWEKWHSGIPDVKSQEFLHFCPGLLGALRLEAPGCCVRDRAVLKLLGCETMGRTQEEPCAQRKMAAWLQARPLSPCCLQIKEVPTFGNVSDQLTMCKNVELHSACWNFFHRMPGGLVLLKTILKNTSKWDITKQNSWLSFRRSKCEGDFYYKFLILHVA